MGLKMPRQFMVLGHFWQQTSGATRAEPRPFVLTQLSDHFPTSRRTSSSTGRYIIHLGPSNKMVNIEFPPGWSNERFNGISSEEYSQVSNEVSSQQIPCPHLSIQDSPLTTFPGTSGTKASSSKACFLGRVCKTSKTQPDPVVGHHEASYASLLCAPWLDRGAGQRS